MVARYSETDLLAAAWSGDEVKVKQVLSSKLAWLNARVTQSIRRRHPDFDEQATSLHLAARMGHEGTVEVFLTLHADVNVVSASGATPLHAAAMGGHSGVANALLDHGASANAPDADGCTPLHHAASGGHHKACEALVRRGAQVDAKDGKGNTPLHYAAKTGSEPVVRLLLAVGARVNALNDQGRTPLHMTIMGADHSAAAEAYPELESRRQATQATVNRLLSHGADVNAVDVAGETPLDLLTYLEGAAGTDPLVDLLLANGGQWVRFRDRFAESAGDQANSEATVAGLQPPGLAAPEKGPAHDKPPEDQRGEPIALAIGTSLVGRDASCDLCYQSRTLSRRHAQIERQEEGVVIIDLDSRNGTFIDGERIRAPHLLEPGQVITMGAYEFEFDGTHLIPLRGELSEEELRSQRVSKSQSANSDEPYWPRRRQ